MIFQKIYKNENEKENTYELEKKIDMNTNIKGLNAF